MIEWTLWIEKGSMKDGDCFDWEALLSRYLLVSALLAVELTLLVMLLRTVFSVVLERLSACFS